MKGIHHRQLIITIVGALSLGLLQPGLVGAQEKSGRKSPEKEKPAAEKKAAPKPEKEAAAQKPRTKAEPRRPAAPPLPAPGPRGEPTTYLGVAATEVPPAVRAHLDLPRGVGISVGQVMPESPAAKSGLKAHDVLTKLDDQLLVTPEQFQILVRMKEPGDKVALTYLRAGKELTARITLASHRFPVTSRQGGHPRPHGQPGNRDWEGQWRHLEREWGTRMRDWWEENGDKITEQIREAMDDAFDGGGNFGPHFDEWLDDVREHGRPGQFNPHREREEREDRAREERRENEQHKRDEHRDKEKDPI